MEPLKLLQTLTTLNRLNAARQPFNSPQQLPAAPPPLGQLVDHGNINYPDLNEEVEDLLVLILDMYKTDTRFSSRSIVREHDEKLSRMLNNLVSILTPNKTYLPLTLILSSHNITALENLVKSHLQQPYIQPATCECWGCMMRCETATITAQKAFPNRDRNYPCTFTSACPRPSS